MYYLVETKGEFNVVVKYLQKQGASFRGRCIYENGQSLILFVKDDTIKYKKLSDIKHTKRSEIIEFSKTGLVNENSTLETLIKDSLASESNGIKKLPPNGEFKYVVSDTEIFIFSKSMYHDDVAKHLMSSKPTSAGFLMVDNYHISITERGSIGLALSRVGDVQDFLKRVYEGKFEFKTCY